MIVSCAGGGSRGCSSVSRKSCDSSTTFWACWESTRLQGASTYESSIPEALTEFDKIARLELSLIDPKNFSELWTQKPVSTLAPTPFRGFPTPPQMRQIGLPPLGIQRTHSVTQSVSFTHTDSLTDLTLAHIPRPASRAHHVDSSLCELRSSLNCRLPVCVNIYIYIHSAYRKLCIHVYLFAYICVYIYIHVYVCSRSNNDQKGS